MFKIKKKYLFILLIISSSSTSEAGSKTCTSTCNSDVCKDLSQKLLENIDLSVNPCDNFFKFACGGYMKIKKIPDDKTQVSVFSDLDVHVHNQLKTILKSPINATESDTLTLAKRFYKECTDTDAIEINNLKTAKELIHKLGGWPVVDGGSWKEDEFDWKNQIYKLRKYGFSVKQLLKVSVEQHALNSSRRVIGLDQAQLPFNYANLKNGFDDIVVKSYYNNIVDFAVIFGANRTKALAEIKEVVNFIFEILKISLAPEDRRNFTTMTNLMTVAELNKKYSHMNWTEFLNNVVALPNVKIDENSIVDVGVPSFLNNLEILLNKADKRIQANYLIISALGGVGYALNSDIRDCGHKMLRELIGAKTDETRENECLAITTITLPLAVGALYVRSFFKQSSKDKVENLVSNLHSNLVKILEEVNWMDDETRQEALAKASYMKPFVGYPSELMDDETIDSFYAPLERSDDFFELVINIQKFDSDRSFRRLAEKVERGFWVDNSGTHTINAYYNLVENTIVLPAGILQGMMYDADRPEAMNYASIGFIIGHELTHGFDDMGKQINKDGQLQNWWTEKTAAEYNNKADCIIKQYGNYSSNKVKLNVNGVITQGENIADNGGIKVAYETYQSWAKENDTCLPNLNYTQNQLFWISFANTWCTITREEHLKLEILTSDHSPAYFRVLGTVSNSKYFADDFQCPLGSSMNPVNKCIFW